MTLQGGQQRKVQLFRDKASYPRIYLVYTGRWVL